jgi:hypothetical protein
MTRLGQPRSIRIPERSSVCSRLRFLANPSRLRIKLSRDATYCPTSSIMKMMFCLPLFSRTISLDALATRAKPLSPDWLLTSARLGSARSALLVWPDDRRPEQALNRRKRSDVARKASFGAAGSFQGGRERHPFKIAPDRRPDSLELRPTSRWSAAFAAESRVEVRRPTLRASHRSFAAKSLRQNSNTATSSAASPG